MIDIETLYWKFRVPENIRKHSIAVSKTGKFLAEKLEKSGKKVDVLAVETACMLHDIDKIMTLDKMEGHGEIAGKEIESLGFKKIADCVRHHGLGSGDKLKSIGEKIVYYADKRNEGEKPVTLEERMEGILERYAKNKKQEEDIRGLFRKAKKVEEDLFKVLPFRPEELNGEMENEG